MSSPLPAGKFPRKNCSATASARSLTAPPGQRISPTGETAPVLKPKGKAQWDGVIKEQDIKGNLKWVTKSGETRYYFINGKRR